MLTFLFWVAVVAVGYIVAQFVIVMIATILDDRPIKSKASAEPYLTFDDICQMTESEYRQFCDGTGPCRTEREWREYIRSRVVPHNQPPTPA
jgi:hypothetical protein